VRATNLGAAALRHAERIQARQRLKEERAQRDQIALERAKRAHVREKQEKLKREQEAEIARRDELARALYEKMVNGLRAEEIRKVRGAAKKIQKVWRGCMARTLMQKRHTAATRVQAAFRSFLCRESIKRANIERVHRQQQEAMVWKQSKAAATIQRRVRLFLQRLAIIREYRGRQMRRFFCARSIQRCFRDFHSRREQRILAQLEAERDADERRFQLHTAAAKKIQKMFRDFKRRRIARVLLQEQRRRGNAATKIQALFRGALTRIWFQHYRMYRKQQQLSSARNVQAVVKIQSVWRGSLARRKKRRLQIESQFQKRQQMLFRAARSIQCAWRCHSAREAVLPLRRAQHLRRQAAKAIQGIYQMYKERCRFLKRRDAARRIGAARKIQEWYRERAIINKQRETARYHADIQRKQRVALLLTSGTIAVQSLLRCRMSQLIAESMRASHNRIVAVALTLQRASRGFRSRLDTAVLKHCAYLVDSKNKREQLEHKSACIIQRAIRCSVARSRAEFLKRADAASLIIQTSWRMCAAKMTLTKLKAEKLHRRRVRAATSIQRLVRRFLRQVELRRLDEYYKEKQNQKLLQMRREEAAITIQAVWRGMPPEWRQTQSATASFISRWT
jgi:hypothetical protein